MSLTHGVLISSKNLSLKFDDKRQIERLQKVGRVREWGNEKSEVFEEFGSGLLVILQSVVGF